LKSTHDDAFFKVCRMRGIAFDINNRVGTLFFLVDSIVGGAISVLCIGMTRKKSLEIAVHTLSFIAREFGMDTTTSALRYENLTSMLLNLKKLLRHQDKEG
jgi:sulfur transfer protein SufE